MTYVDIVRPVTKKRAYIFDSALIIAGSLLIALSAQVMFPLPFTPVPVTGQTFGVLMVAALLGSRRGTFAVISYLIEGLAGLPFFAGGTFGAAILAGTSGGYLIGFIIAAFIVGYLSERGWDHRFGSTIFMMAFGTLAIYILGAMWLAQFVSISQVFLLGVIPFVVGAVSKIILAALLLPSGWKFLNYLGWKKN